MIHAMQKAGRDEAKCGAVPRCGVTCECAINPLLVRCMCVHPYNAAFIHCAAFANWIQWMGCGNQLPCFHGGNP